MATDADRVSPKAKTYHAGSVRDVAACELNLSGSQLVFAYACFPGAAKLLLWDLLKLWLIETSRLIPKYFQYYRLIVSPLRLCSYRLVV